MLTSAGSAIFLLRAASAIAFPKEADQPAANSCSGLVPMRAEPGVESLMSSRPSELRDAPFSRSPVVLVLAVYTTFAIRLVLYFFLRSLSQRERVGARKARAQVFRPICGVIESLREPLLKRVSAVPRPQNARLYRACCNGRAWDTPALPNSAELDRVRQGKRSRPSAP